MSKEIIFLFGEMGVGKNYWGEAMAKEKGYPFLDGDTLALPEMKELVGKFKPLSKELVSRFVDNMAIEIVEKMDGINGIVVAQALYMREDRAFLQLMLTALGYKVRFVWVRVPFMQNMRQLYSRPNGLRWVLYGLLNKWFFQKPDCTCETLPV